MSGRAAQPSGGEPAGRAGGATDVVAARVPRPPTARDALSWWCCLLAIVAFALCTQALLFWRVPEFDTHVWLLMGRWWTEAGLWPYRDTWELKPPGIFLYLRGTFALLPVALWSVRLCDVAWAVGGGLACFGFLRPEVGRLWATIAACAWLWFTYHPWFCLGGIYTEQYAAVLMLAACWAARSGWALSAGALVVAAATFKHPALSAALPVLWLVGRQAWLRIGLGGGTVLALVLAFAALPSGVWTPFVECNWTALVRHGQLDGTLPWAERGASMGRSLLELGLAFPPLAVMAMAGLSHATLIALAWLGVDLIGVALQRQFAWHHYILCFPALIWISAQVVARARRFRIAVALVLLLWLPGYLHALLPAVAQALPQLGDPGTWPAATGREFEQQVGAFVRNHTEATDRLTVVGWNATALSIYWSADRLPAARHFYGVCCGIPVDKMADDIMTTRPRAVVLVNLPMDLAIRGQLEAVGYRPAATFAADYSAEVWLRGSPATGGGDA